MSALIVSAPAKINLALRVGPVERSGFHPLASWMCTVALFDTLSIARAGGADIAFTCDDPLLPCDNTNLAVRAARRMLRFAGVESTGLSIGLRKQIPSAAGLGGGSSDAAAVLTGLNALLKLGVTLTDLAKLAAELGSDVPFFLHAPSAWCTGRGEIIQPLPPPAVVRWALLLLPEIRLSTAAVYRRFDELRLGRYEDLSPPVDLMDWLARPALELLPGLINDLERAAFSLEPMLGQMREAIEQILQRPVRMSGSGSTLFTLFDDRDSARAALGKVGKVDAIRPVVAELSPTPNNDAYDSIVDVE